MRAYVDKDACISCGLCVSLYPEIFYFDDDKAKAIEEDLRENQEAEAQEAMEKCPVDAISAE